MAVYARILRTPGVALLIAATTSAAAVRDQRPRGDPLPARDQRARTGPPGWSRGRWRSEAPRGAVRGEARRPPRRRMLFRSRSRHAARCPRALGARRARFRPPRWSRAWSRARPSRPRARCWRALARAASRNRSPSAAPTPSIRSTIEISFVSGPLLTAGLVAVRRTPGALGALRRARHRGHAALFLSRLPDAPRALPAGDEDQRPGPVARAPHPR